MEFNCISFTGHRPQHIGGFDERNETAKWIKTTLARVIIKCMKDYNVQEWVTGLALGVDQWAAEILLLLKTNGYPAYIIGMKPFPSQDIKWNEKNKDRFHAICERLDEVIDCQPDPYAPWKMEFRNKEMVKRANMVIAVWNGKDGGTGNCVAIAKRLKRPILRIDPSTQTVFWERGINE